MIESYPVTFHLKDGTHVLVTTLDGTSFDFHLTRLNSEKHNFIWNKTTGEIEESYETRFDQWQHEAISIFNQMQADLPK